MSKVKNIKLNNGVLMPQQGLGVFQISDYEQCKQNVKDALNLGYRAIDTAQVYHNENAVGDAISESNINRKDLFITTKVWLSNFSKDKTIKSVENSLKKLKTDYLDLVILHQPLGDVIGAYRGLEKLYNDGKIRAIGISNFDAMRYVDFIQHVNVVPAVNQVETHVFYQEKDTQSWMNKYGTRMEAWGPLAEGKKEIFQNPILNIISEKYNKTAAQVALRFLVQSGIIIISKSLHIKRLKENLSIWDFELNDNEMKAIQSLDSNQSVTLDRNDPKSVLFINGVKSSINRQF